MHKPEIKYLYKYRACNEFSLKNLRNSSLWAASPPTLNDPFDCDLDIDADIDPVEFLMFIASQGIQEEQGNEFIEQAMLYALANQSEIKEMIINHSTIAAKEGQGRGVVSLSSDPTHKLMWAHYGDSHKGFCMQFERKEGNIWGSELCREVNYTNVYPKLRASEVLRNQQSGKVDELLITKSPEWAYEKEWRLIYPEGNVEIGGQIDLSGIVFGLKATGETIEKVRDALRESKSVKFYKVHQEGKSYELVMRAYGET